MLRSLFCAVVLFVCLIPSPAAACSCARPAVSEAFNRAHVVAVGVVTGVRMLDHRDGSVVRVDVTVREGLKNASANSRISVYGDTGIGSCWNLPFVVGRRYIIFAAPIDVGSPIQLPVPTGANVVSLCGGTVEHGSVEGLRTLRQLRAIVRSPSGRRRKSQSSKRLLDRRRCWPRSGWCHEAHRRRALRRTVRPDARFVRQCDA